MFEHTNSKHRKQENKEEQVLIWKYVKKRKGGALPLPAKTIMMDANDLWPTMYLTMGRCRFPGCKGRSHVISSKCSTSGIKMALCLN